ncbi:phosphatase PAP2 family protein [Paenibacillus sp. MWE-103]|uniref:Phosphatase PAP2 family protein n=1 Tax=Paenibacillus artemisiicola TaxID=1172618 RepID=A0ABS3W430_9BACL|nr:phosphatase PAP2 family protein [Paenibacillus artemisiicola]
MNKLFFRSLTGAFLLLGLFLALAVTIGRHHIAAFDSRVTEAVSRLASPAMTAVMIAFTAAGSGPCVTLLSLLGVLVLFALGYRRELIFFVGVIVCSGLLNVLLKALFRRTRPDLHRIIDAAGYSFPSGHSMSAFTLYGVTIYFLWKHARHAGLRTALLLGGIAMTACIGISRIYLGVHYPSDVAGGYIISASWLAASIGSYERFLKERWSKKLPRPRSDFG